MGFKRERDFRFKRVVVVVVNFIKHQNRAITGEGGF